MDLPFAYPSPVRASDTLSRPNFIVPSGAIDAHFHVFEPGYPAGPAPQYSFPEATTEQFLAMCKALSIARGVLVQPTYYGENNTLLVDTLERIGEQVRGVARLGPSVESSELRRLDAAGVRAVRVDLFPLKDASTEAVVRHLQQWARRVEPLGWHLQFYAPGAVIMRAVPYLADLPVKYSLDHFGYMPLHNADLVEPHLNALLAALDTDRCFIKLTGAYRIAQDGDLGGTTPLARRLISARPDRMLWGTDWPHLPNGEFDTGILLNLLSLWAPEEEARRLILVDNPEGLMFA